jgi:hypothetical protein
MITVRFNDPEEFAAELAREKPSNGLLRLTQQFERSKMSPYIAYVSVLGSFLRDGEIVSLRRYCGDHWQNGDRKALDRAQDVMRDLEDVAKRLGIEVRAGVYEEAKE